MLIKELDLRIKRNNYSFIKIKKNELEKIKEFVYLDRCFDSDFKQGLKERNDKDITIYKPHKYSINDYSPESLTENVMNQKNFYAAYVLNRAKHKNLVDGWENEVNSVLQTIIFFISSNDGKTISGWTIPNEIGENGSTYCFDYLNEIFFHLGLFDLRLSYRKTIANFEKRVLKYLIEKVTKSRINELKKYLSFYVNNKEKENKYNLKINALTENNIQDYEFYAAYVLDDYKLGEALDIDEKSGLENTIIFVSSSDNIHISNVFVQGTNKLKDSIEVWKDIGINKYPRYKR